MDKAKENMSIEDIITLGDNRELLILDIIDYKESKYIYCVEVDEEENPKENFIFLKLGQDEDGEYVIEVKDEATINKILAIFTANYLNDKDDEEDV